MTPRQLIEQLSARGNAVRTQAAARDARLGQSLSALADSLEKANRMLDQGVPEGTASATWMELQEQASRQARTIIDGASVWTSMGNTLVNTTPTPDTKDGEAPWYRNPWVIGGLLGAGLLAVAYYGKEN